MGYFQFIGNKVIRDGYHKMSNSKVSICSIVRDCQNNLKRNIQKIEELRKKFLDSEVVIFENDSKDRTLEILKKWGRESNNIILKSEKYGNKTIPEIRKGENSFFSRERIGKMSFYRNMYLEIINTNNFKREYVIVIDLDIANFSIDGIAHSFGLKQDWSCITSNGTSLSKTLRRRYHDTYALVEKGAHSMTMDEATIYNNQRRFSFFRSGMPLFAVDSSFGGMAIYDWKFLKGKFYSCIPNDNQKVPVLCEHVSINRQLGGNIFINPNMKVKYRYLTLQFIYNQLKKRFLII
jgi:glycosyltransferase involved in cell wall biosynthesis